MPSEIRNPILPIPSPRDFRSLAPTCSWSWRYDYGVNLSKSQCINAAYLMTFLADNDHCDPGPIFWGLDIISFSYFPSCILRLQYYFFLSHIGWFKSEISKQITRIVPLALPIITDLSLDVSAITTLNRSLSPLYTQSNSLHNMALDVTMYDQYLCLHQGGHGVSLVRTTAISCSTSNLQLKNYWSKQLRHGIKIDGAKRQCERNERKWQLASCITYTQ